MTHSIRPVRRKPPLRLYDRSAQCLTDDVLLPFAFEECAMREVAESGIPAVHLWRHRRAVVLGLRDRKLPQAAEAIRWLEDEGFQVGVRHSGGAAVPLDPGVLNVTLMVPKPPGQLDFHDDFVQMSEWIAGVVNPGGLPVAVGEIRGSYCPGNYDLSIHGKKILRHRPAPTSPRHRRAGVRQCGRERGGAQRTNPPILSSGVGGRNQRRLRSDRPPELRDQPGRIRRVHRFGDRSGADTNGGAIRRTLDRDASSAV